MYRVLILWPKQSQKRLIMSRRPNQTVLYLIHSETVRAYGSIHTGSMAKCSR